MAIRRNIRPIPTLLLATACLAAQSTIPARHAGTLQLGHPADHELQAGQTDEFLLNVKAGRFVRVVARQMGVDVAVKILDPDGKTIHEVDRPNEAFGPEAASFIGSKGGTYRIQVSSNPFSSGRYQMEWLEMREPTAADQSRIEAENLELQAEREDEKATKDSRLHALELYERAGSLWRGLGDTYELALTLCETGLVHFYLGDKPQAKDSFEQALPLFRTVGDHSGEAVALSRIGLYYSSIGNGPKAVEYKQQALPLFHDAGNQSGEAGSLYGIANYY